MQLSPAPPGLLPPDLGKPERTCSPSTFWLTRKLRKPLRSSCTRAMWVFEGRALSKVVSNLGARPRSSMVHTPWGPLRTASRGRRTKFIFQPTEDPC